MLIKVAGYPDSHEDNVVEVASDAYEVYVRASAQHGHANKVVTALLGKHFGTSVRMMTGGVRTHKVFRIG